MRSANPGINTLPVKVIHISPYGLSLSLNDEELFLSFSEFPWFLNATIGKIFHIELPFPNHLYWPELDIDLSVESIRHPEQFPLVNQLS